MPRARPTLVGVLVVGVLAACGTSPPSATEGPTVVPSADPVLELEATGAPLPAGTYTRTSFEPRITLDLDGAWEAVQLFDGFFDVQQLVGTPDVIAVQFALVGGVHGADGPATAGGAADAVTLLGGNPGLAVIETSESRIGGLAGEQVTVENTGGEHANVVDVPPGPLGIDSGRRLWVAFFETDAGLLAIMVGGSVARWDDALAAAEPVLESIRIGP